MAQPNPSSSQTEHTPKVSITPLLKKIGAYDSIRGQISASEIALAWSRVFEDRLSGTQLSSLLTLLYVTGLDKRPDVIAKCAESMRDAATSIDEVQLKRVLRKRKDRKRGSYRGGVCDIVGTGGDHHSTFNISTTASIIASPMIAMAKHGNRAQTSMSGSADVLKAIVPKAPILEALTAEKLPEAYEQCNYAFLLAPNFHPGMKYAATVRKELGLRTIFNLMGPLANPVEKSIEARVIGVAYQELGPIFAEALQLYKTTKAMVVCGQEDLDEISCAGPTNCWWLKEVSNPKYKSDTRKGGENADDDDNDEDTSDDDAEREYISKLEHFQLSPADFGLPSHPLSEVGGGKLPNENAKVLIKILRGELGPDHPIVHFVLMNVAALLVVSGVCDADDSDFGDVIKETGPAGGRWKEGVRLARYCIESGKALQELEKFIDFTNKIASA